MQPTSVEVSFNAASHAHSDELIRLPATRIVDLLNAGEILARDVVEAAIARVEAVDGAVNALPVRCFDRARAQADAMQRSGAQTLLGGLPIVVKDNNDVGGVGTSGGTPIFRDRVPPESDRTVARMERHGAIPLAKANLSELGGANTTNRLFGATRNPWNTALTCGGSSGGSAVAVATGQVWVAHGNDVGGSLRVPPAFCGIVGLRPTPGRVVRKALCDPFDTVMVDGPLARSVEDLALLFDAMVGFDARDPLSAPSPDAPFRAHARQPHRPARGVAYCAAPGRLPVDEAVAAVCEAAMARLAVSGLSVQRAEPDTAGALEAIRIIRGDAYATAWEPTLGEHAPQFTEDVMGDVQRGLAQSAADVRAAGRFRAALSRRMSAFFEKHDFLVCPSTQAMPFPVDVAWPREIAGQALSHYTDWLAINYVWSLTGCPVLAMPAGLSATGLPVGLQIIGPPRSEGALLRLGAWIERELGRLALPIDPR
jgi:amidase